MWRHWQNLKFGLEITVKSATNVIGGQLPKTKNIQEEITVDDMNIVINGQTLNNSETSNAVAFLKIWTIPVLPVAPFTNMV